MPRPDEGLIHEWLDGELSPEESARVERLVAEDPEWGAAAAEARGLVAASSRILGALDAVPGDVLPQGSRAAPALTAPARTAPSRATFTARPWMKVAAGLVLVAGTAYTLRERGMTPLAEQEIAMSAPALERAPLEQSVIGPQKSEPAIGPLPRAVPTIGAPSPRQVAGAAGSAAAASSRGADSSVVAGVAATDVAATDVATETRAQAERALEPQRFAQEQRARAEATERATTDASARARAITGATMDDRASDLARSRVANADVARSAPAPAPVQAPPPAPPSVSAAPTAALRGAAGGLAAKALSVRALEGCWRTETRAGADSVLATPMIVRTFADSIVIVAGPAARPATVVRTDSELRGVMNDVSGIRVAFRARSIACPAVPDATPSPRR